MKKQLLTKMLLMAAILFAGMNAWAADKTVVKYSFDDAYSPELTAGSRVSFDYTKTSVITSTKFLNAFNNANGDPGATTVSLGSTDLTEETWTLTFEWAAVGGCNSKPDHTTLKAGDTNLFDISGNSNWNTTVTLSYGASGTATIPVPGCDKGKRFSAGTGDQLNTTAYWHHFVITGSKAGGVKMTVTNSNSGSVIVADVVLSEDNVNPTSIILEPCCGGAIGIDELSLAYYVEGEVIQTPTAAITGVNGINRTITATCETDGADLYYSTDDGANWTKGAEVTVDASCTVWFKGVKGTSDSDILKFAVVAGTAIQLNAPLINRTSNTSVTITADQTDKLLSPTATIYYEYGAEKGSFTGSKVLTVAADDVITAYAEATGYTTSETSSRAVALFPENVEALENTASKTAGWTEQTWGSTTVVSERNYAPVLLDGVQWGKIALLQKDASWMLRTKGEWYNNSNTVNSYILFPSMKAGDIVVVNISYPADDVINATASKYTFGTQYAYEVTADGDVELGFKKINAGEMDYLYGVYAYRAVASVDVTVGANGNSFASSYAIDCANLPSGVKAYKVSAVAGSKATLTEVTEAVAPGTGLILIGAGTHSIPTALTGNDISATNKLVGVTADKTIGADEAYGLKNGKFVKLTDGTIPAGKAYLPAAVSAPELDIVFDGNTTGISATLVNSEKVNSDVYDLQGRKVMNPTKGLYIVNGKKFAVK